MVTIEFYSLVKSKVCDGMLSLLANTIIENKFSVASTTTGCLSQRGSDGGWWWWMLTALLELSSRRPGIMPQDNVSSADSEQLEFPRYAKEP